MKRPLASAMWRRRVPRWLFGLLAAIGAFAYAGQPIVEAQSTAESSDAMCLLDSFAELEGLEATLRPPSGATVQAGATVTLSGNPSVPVSFAVASSAALLSSPDIASGPGLVTPGKEGGSIYTFSSPAVTAAPRTVYWAASFSSSAVPGCAGAPSMTYTTAARTLTVTPAPSTEAPPATLPPSTPGPTSPVVPPALQVSIRAPSRVLGAHSTVSYVVQCTASCHGSSVYRVLVERGHARTEAVRALDVKIPVSISGASGGRQQLAHRYSGRALKLLKKLVREGVVLKLQISVDVTGTSAGVVQAHASTSLNL